MSDALEMARCVEINIQNMVEMMPVLKMHPLLAIVQMQIKQCVELLEKAEKSETSALLASSNADASLDEHA